MHLLKVEILQKHCLSLLVELWTPSLKHFNTLKYILWNLQTCFSDSPDMQGNNNNNNTFFEPLKLLISSTDLTVLCHYWLDWCGYRGKRMLASKGDLNEVGFYLWESPLCAFAASWTPSVRKNKFQEGNRQDETAKRHFLRHLLSLTCKKTFFFASLQNN